MAAVEIVERSTETVVKRIPCDSERSAEKVERGVNINLNHDEFFTRIADQAAPLLPQHAIEEDRTVSGYERWTCHSCSMTCLRAPFMSDAEWSRKLSAWHRAHPKGEN